MSNGLFAKAYDSLLGVVNPKKAAYNRMWREHAHEFAYRAATRNRLRSTKLGLGGTGDKHASWNDLYTLREYARALDRDNAIASAMLDRACEAIIGTGIDVQVYSGLKTWDDKAEAMWHEWWDNEADIRGFRCGWEMEHAAYRAMKVDGDVLYILTDTGQVQAIEAERIATPARISTQADIVNGVKLDKYGKPLLFYVAEEAINSTIVPMSMKFDEINAENCVFLANRNRLSQTRGVSAFATNMQLFDDIDAFIETCILHAKVAASHVMFVERHSGGADIDSVESVTDSYDNDRTEQVVSPGMILYGKPGEKATMVGTTQTMVQFAPFVQQLLRFTGLNFGMPLEMLSLDFSQTNYSSARAALLVAHRAFLAEHKMMTHRFIEPILRWKMSQWVAEGRLPERKFTVGATPPKTIQVDPLKEAKANRENVAAGFHSVRDVCASEGMDWYEVLHQRANEIKEAKKLADKLGIDWKYMAGVMDEFVGETKEEVEDVEED